MAKSEFLDVPGIRVSRAAGADASSRPVLPNGRPASEFSWCFKSILPELDAYHWLLDLSDGFNWLWDDEPATQRVRALLGDVDESFEFDDAGVSSGPFHHAPRLMSEVAPYVRDDWTSLHGFRKLPADAERIAELRDDNERGREFLPLVDVLFENWDAALWHLYTRNAALIERVRTDLANDPSVRVEAAPPLEIEP